MATARWPCLGLGCGPVGFVIRFHFSMGAAMMTVDHIIFSCRARPYATQALYYEWSAAPEHRRHPRRRRCAFSPPTKGKRTKKRGGGKCARVARRSAPVSRFGVSPSLYHRNHRFSVPASTSFFFVSRLAIVVTRLGKKFTTTTTTTTNFVRVLHSRRRFSRQVPLTVGLHGSCVTKILTSLTAKRAVPSNGSAAGHLPCGGAFTRAV